MSSRRTILVFLLVGLAFGLCLPATGRSEEGHRSRLIVDNRSHRSAVVQIWRHDGKSWDWRLVGRVKDGQWVPIYDVRNQERLRARIDGRGDYLWHTVRLQKDKNGALQDLWRLQ